MELDAAREILAEVFGVKLSEVDEMIENRFVEDEAKMHSRGDGLWPRELWIEGWDLSPSLAQSAMIVDRGYCLQL